MANMFFILGNPRSGTTLFRLMLNNHPNITIPPECGFALWLYEKYKVVNFSRGDFLGSFLKDLSVAKKFETWQLELAELEAYLRKRSPVNYRQVVEGVYEFYAHMVGSQASLLGDKNNFYLDYIDEIKTLFPEAKILFIVRDGRDVACSYRELASRKINSKYAPQLPSSIEAIAREWSANNAKIQDALDSNALLIRYEDLLLDTKATLEKVCQHLNVSYHNDMLNYHINHEGHEPAEFLQWKEKIIQPPDSRNIGKYSAELSAHEIKIFESIAGAELEAFGYLTSMHGSAIF